MIMKYIILVILSFILIPICNASGTPMQDKETATSEEYKLFSLQEELNSYIAGKDARIGVAAIINGRDTISVNGTAEFPMMSVFKFPLALTVADWVDANSISLNDSISFNPNILIEDTYSPMLKKYGPGLNRMSFRELLEWSLIESDNNAADILIQAVGGTTHSEALLKDLAGDLEIRIGATERDMHDDPSRSNLNWSTPLAMAVLFDRFDREIRYRSASYSDISTMLEECKTGVDRLASPLSGTGAVIGHKTGTGFSNPAGGISALNDCGYIHLPNGVRYTIAVFVADSPYNIEETAKLIADISERVYQYCLSLK